MEGGTEAQRKVFYTALYRCYERMINITEDGRYYSGFDHKVHEDPRPFYVDNWLWDTFRALEPLQTLLNPDVEADKIQSYVRMYQQAGIMPTFAIVDRPLCLHERQPLRAVVCRRLVQRRAQLRSARLPIEGIRKRSLEETLLPWRLGPKGPLDDFYAAHGYMPALCAPVKKKPTPWSIPSRSASPFLSRLRTAWTTGPSPTSPAS